MGSFRDVSKMCDKELECEYEWTYHKAREIEDKLERRVYAGYYKPRLYAERLTQLEDRLSILGAELVRRGLGGPR